MMSPDSFPNAVMVDMVIDSMDDVFSFIVEFDYKFKKQEKQG